MKKEKYIPSEEEIKMINHLREKGYKINSPPCPACNNYGFIMTGGSFPGGGWVGNADCPLGCPKPILMNG